MNNVLKNISQLLQTIEENAITGIYRYDSKYSSNPYVTKDPENFLHIIDVINRFKSNHQKIAWTPFLTIGKRLHIRNITISNTQVRSFIDKITRRSGLNYFDSTYRYKPY